MTNLRLPHRFHRSRDALALRVQPEQSNRRRRRERQHRQSRRSSRRLGNVVADDLSPPRRRPPSVGCPLPSSSSSSPITAPALERPIVRLHRLPLSLSLPVVSRLHRIESRTKFIATCECTGIATPSARSIAACPPGAIAAAGTSPASANDDA